MARNTPSVNEATSAETAPAGPVFAAMRQHFSEQEIVESILAIGFYMTMARLTEATEVDLDPAAGMTVFEGGKKRSG